MNHTIQKAVLFILVGFQFYVSLPWRASGHDCEALIKTANKTDLNADGIDEIERFELVSEWSAEKVNRDDKLLFVMIEDRLLTEATADSDQQLAATIGQYCRHLLDDGWTPVAIRASVYAGEAHQDGRTLLATRRVFQATKKEFPKFGGAILIGSFPESMLVRRWAWKHNKRSATFNGVTCAP